MNATSSAVGGGGGAAAPAAVNVTPSLAEAPPLRSDEEALSPLRPPVAISAAGSVATPNPSATPPHGGALQTTRPTAAAHQPQSAAAAGGAASPRPGAPQDAALQQPCGAAAAPPAAAAPADASRSHVFLSNAQWSGGDQCLVLRDMLSSAKHGISVWLDQDNDPTASGMELGVESSAVVVLFLSKGYFPRPAVQREVKKAVELRKRILLVHQEESSDPQNGEPLGSILTEAQKYARDKPERDKDTADARPFLTLEDLLGREHSIFSSAGSPSPQPQHPGDLFVFDSRDSAGLETMVERLAARIKALTPTGWGAAVAPPGAPFKLRRLPRTEPRAGGEHLLLASGAQGQRQLLYLKTTLLLHCPNLRVRILPHSAMPPLAPTEAAWVAATAAAGAAVTALGTAAKALTEAQRLLDSSEALAASPVGDFRFATQLMSRGGDEPSWVTTARSVAKGLAERAAQEAGVGGDAITMEANAADDARGRDAATKADFLLVLLTKDVFSSHAVRGALSAALEWPAEHKRLILRHEPDAWRGGAEDFGCEFLIFAHG